MSEYVTKNDLKEALSEQDARLEKRFDDLADIIGTLAQSMHNEIVELKHDNKELKDTLNRLMNTIDGFIGRIDAYETEQTARDAQFARLLEWAKEVSKKTGIPLKGF